MPYGQTVPQARLYVCGKLHVIALVVSCTYSQWNGSTCAGNIVGPHAYLVTEKNGGRVRKARDIYFLLNFFINCFILIRFLGI